MPKSWGTQGLSSGGNSPPHPLPRVQRRGKERVGARSVKWRHPDSPPNPPANSSVQWQGSASVQGWHHLAAAQEAPGLGVPPVPVAPGASVDTGKIPTKNLQGSFHRRHQDPKGPEIPWCCRQLSFWYRPRYLVQPCFLNGFASSGARLSSKS